MTLGIDLTKTNYTAPVGTDHYTIELTKALITGHPELGYILFVASKEGVAWWGQAFSSSNNVKIVQIATGFLINRLSLLLATFQYRQLAWLWLPVPSLLLCHRPGLKVMVTIHGLEFNQGIGRKLGLDWATRWSVWSANKVVAVSEYTRGKILSAYHSVIPGAATGDPAKIAVIYEGVDPAVFYPRSQSEIDIVKHKYDISGQYFLFVGTLQPRKNLVKLVEGFSRFVGEGLAPKGALIGLPSRTDVSPAVSLREPTSANWRTPTTLVISGSSGWSTEEIYAAPKKYGVDDLVKFLGRVEDFDLPALYSGAVATCLASLEEGFGLPVLQSLACGRPVVISDRGALPELVNDSVGVVVNPAIPANIAQGLKKILERSGDITLSQTCLTRSGEFSWKKAADRLISLLLEVRWGKTEE